MVLEKISFRNQRLEWIGLGSVLRNDLLKVPPYQRSYNWDIAHLDDFWDDLYISKENNRGEYFMGPIIIAAPHGNEHRYTIIDGQQRLATASILISVLAGHLTNYGDTETARDIDRDYLGSQDLRTRTVTHRLILNEADRHYFTETISRKIDKIPSSGPASHKLIFNAFKYFNDQINKFSPKEPKEFREWVIDWIDYIRDKTIIMLAVIPNESEAFAIFEALNARGSRLAIADLLKNHLYSCASKSLEDVKHHWDSAVTKINEADDDINAVTDFLRHYWNSRNPIARERELYRQFRSQIHDEKDASTFADDLDSAASDYAALLNAGHPKWRNLGTETFNAINTLFNLKLEQNRPMLLAAMRNLPDKELSILSHWLLYWTVRGVIVGGIGKGKYEVAYARAAMAITEGSAKQVIHIYKILESIIPTNPEFEVAFQNYRTRNAKFAHYILRALEKGERGEKEPYLVVNPDTQELTLEHVLPQNPNKNEWPQFKSSDIVEEYAYRLGNLALIPRSPNRKIGNKPFKAKLPTYKTADLKLTNEIAEEQVWNQSTIISRQLRLSKLALKVWPLIPK